MKRGDLVTIAFSGDYRKPRPALVVQSDAFEDLDSAIVVPLTSHIQDAPLLRVSIEPNPTNGLRKRSAAMVDKVVTVSRERIGPRFGQVDADTLAAVSTALRGLLEL